MAKKTATAKPPADVIDTTQDVLSGAQVWDQLLKQVDFSSDNIVTAAAENSRLFLRAVTLRMQCVRESNAAKMGYEEARARLSLKLRAEAEAIGQKTTEKGIEALLLIDPDLITLATLRDRADEMEEYSKLVVEAFRMRRDCLEIIKGLVWDEMSLQRAAELNSGKLAELRARVRNKYPGQEA